MNINEAILAAVVAIAADTTLSPMERVNLIGSITTADEGIDEIEEVVEAHLNCAEISPDQAAYLPLGAATVIALNSLADAIGAYKAELYEETEDGPLMPTDTELLDFLQQKKAGVIPDSRWGFTCYVDGVGGVTGKTAREAITNAITAHRNYWNRLAGK